MSQRKFQNWSHQWDSLFEKCKNGIYPFSMLLQHTLNYKKEWNYEL
jgi:hypothetical protein